MDVTGSLLASAAGREGTETGAEVCEAANVILVWAKRDGRGQELVEVKVWGRDARGARNVWKAGVMGCW